MKYGLKVLGSVLIFVILGSAVSQDSFYKQQLKAPRVAEAHRKLSNSLQYSLRSIGTDTAHFEVLFVAYKEEAQLEMYVRNKHAGTYSLLKTYDICAASGGPGPKCFSGDGQVPEGLYEIDRFNPYSQYYLSLGINYPNKADIARLPQGKRGGDIFIHGYCVTIGCLPMTNEFIREIYLYAIMARRNGEANIPVYIFPFRMSAERTRAMIAEINADAKLQKFWFSLQKAYLLFQKNKLPLPVKHDVQGNYLFTNR